MISVVYCTRNTKPEHKEHLIKSSGLHNKIEIIEIINNGESLTKAYNRGIRRANNEIVVLCHDDILIETKQWGRKLLKHFDRNPEYGIIGVAGSKHLSESGRWWDDRKTMYGRVKHTHEGKSWLSSYSDDQDNRVEEVINVDGLFFAVNKNKIKEIGGKYFNEDVEGFHFYDVDFCFDNFINKTCKIGVITNIRINHFSIGQTNQEWEDNRVKFTEKYSDQLPQRVPETFEHRKLRVLIGCLNFQGLTGSELSTLETAKGLSKRGCEVSVVSSGVSDKFNKICKRHGIKTYLITEPPGYKRGDGKWVLNTPKGPQVSKENMLYLVEPNKFDVIHANHTPITEQLLKLYPNSKFVNIVRSEVIDLENPIIDERIKKYIAIRPSIKDYIVNEFGINEDMIETIYNPFDKSRFKIVDKEKNTDKKVTLFVGTMDYLREAPINDLVLKCGENNKELWLVGKDSNGYALELAKSNEHVKYFPPTETIEDFYHMCDETAGIMLGRTTIEGFLCGKPAIIYTVDKFGNILGDDFHEVPEDLSIFDIDTIINKIKNVYVEAYNL